MSKELNSESFRDSLVKAAERRKRSARSQKRKRSDDTSPIVVSDLSPIPEMIQVNEIEEIRSPDQLGRESVKIGKKPVQTVLGTRDEPSQPSEIGALENFVSNKFKSSGSLITDPRVAQKAAAECLLPSDRKEIEGRSINSLIGKFSINFFQMNANFQILQEYLQKFKDSAKVIEAEADRKLKEKDEDLKRIKEALTSKEEESRAYVLETQESFRNLREQIINLQNENTRLQDKLTLAEDNQKHSDKENALLKEKLTSYKGKIIEEYKRSEYFKDDVADRSLTIFYEGFEDCKTQIAKSLPNIDVSQIESSLGKKEEVLGEVGDGEAEELPSADVPSENIPSSSISAGKEKMPATRDVPSPSDVNDV